jgi:hypothetical protein
MEEGAHGPDKLYNKFTVVKSKNVYKEQVGGHKVFHEDDELTNNGEFIVVLRPETNDKAALAALELYSRAIETTYPNFAMQIRDELKRIEREFPDGNPALRGGDPQ